MLYNAGNYVAHEVGVAERDLDHARKSLIDRDEKWATLQACSSVFHAVRALLLARGYRGRTRFGLKVALQAHYVEEGLLAESYVRDFDKAMQLRESAEYRYVLPHQTAAAAQEIAERYLARVKDLLEG